MRVIVCACNCCFYLNVGTVSGLHGTYDLCAWPFFYRADYCPSGFLIWCLPLCCVVFALVSLSHTCEALLIHAAAMLQEVHVTSECKREQSSLRLLLARSKQNSIYILCMIVIKYHPDTVKLSQGAVLSSMLCKP